MKKLLIFVVVLCLGLAGYAHAAKVTHQLAKPWETIMLIGEPNFNANIREITDFKRVLWDGTVEEDYYRIPKNKALVITDVEFEVNATTGDLLVNSSSVDLQIRQLNSGNISKPVARIRFLLDGSFFQKAYISHNMNTGVIVGYGSKIEATVESSFQFSPGYGVLRGYLVDVPKGMR